MSSLKSTIVGCLVSILATSTTVGAETLEPGSISVGGDLTQPPYNYFDADKKASGFDPDFLRALAAASGLKVTFLDTRFENLILGLTSHKFDVVASALYIKPARAKVIDFIPYMKTGVSLGVSSAGNLDPRQPEDLCALRVGTLKGAAWITNLNDVSVGECKDKGGIDIREFPTAAEATQAVLSGNVDVQVEDSAILKQAVTMTAERLRISSTENLYPVIVGLGLSKDNPELKATLEAAFQKIREDGTYAALLAKYNVAEPSQAEFEAAIQ